MKFLSWMQSKINGGEGVKRHNAVPATNHNKIKEPPNQEFSDWPHGLLAIGTLGNTGLKENKQEIRVEQISEIEIPQELQCSSPDFSEFTAEEVGKLQKELKNLLTRKQAEELPTTITADLPLDRFLNCPSSLEVERMISNRFSTYSDDKDEEEIDRTIRIILGRCKDVCEKKNKTIGRKSLSFLVKKMFACTSGFAPTPSLRDTFQESRMEKGREGEPRRSGKSCFRVTSGHGFESYERLLAKKLTRERFPPPPIHPCGGTHPDPRLAGTLRAPDCPFLVLGEGTVDISSLMRTLLTKKMYYQNSYRASSSSSSKKYLEDYRPTVSKAEENEEEDQLHDKDRVGSKWNKTDSEF
ncbi:hypothetical protein OROMI_004504 [Orobanche minor]